MDSPVPKHAAAAPQSQGTTIGIVSGGICCLIVLALLVVIAIALGVGLGVGLSRNNNGGNNNKRANTGATAIVAVATATNAPAGTTAIVVVATATNASAGATAAAPAGTFSILPPPTVNCTYGGSATCGCSATLPLFAAPRVIQGYTARSNSWPWMVVLAIQFGARTARCGGFLITYQHVVTAAHCFDADTQPSDVIVRAGVQTASNVNEGQQRSVAILTRHPNFIEDTVVNDIAVLTLQAPFDQTPTVGLCCTSNNVALPTIDERAVIVGWGATASAANSSASDVLQQAVVQVQQPGSLGCLIQANNNQFCAGFSGTDTCPGDSGGPIMISVNNSWTCIGVVSYSTELCGTNGVYTRIAAYQDFINQQING